MADKDPRKELWELFRRVDGTIDLVGAFEYLSAKDERIMTIRGKQFLRRIEVFMPINSRQAAAIAVAAAFTMHDF